MQEKEVRKLLLLRFNYAQQLGIVSHADHPV